MDSAAQISLALAFAAGLVSFISPCVLALVPVYLAYLGETAAVVGVAAVPAGTRATLVRQPVFGQALLFTASFGVIFTLLGVSVGLLGAGLFTIPALRQAAGLVVIALGLLMTGVFGPILDRFQFGIRPDRLPAGRSARSVALGGLFALGWSPCIGPVLGAILTMGASSQSAPVAALLLGAYSAGLAVPFLLAAVALPKLEPVMNGLRRWHRAVEIVSGLFIMAMGVLIFTNAFARMAGLFTFFL
ncbi:MAG: cytochrome c biogenesis protein CcdA [Chloroflexi bacterium]|nr:cytochrome c biogenesis protein CcdA [Chloroflexota bacterium]